MNSFIAMAQSLVRAASEIKLIFYGTGLSESGII